MSPEPSCSPAPTRRKRPVEDDSSGDNNASRAEEEDWETDDLSITDLTVLSHAERRRQKKRKRQLTSASQSPRKTRKLDVGSRSNVDAKTKVRTTTARKVKATGTPAADDPRPQKRQNSVWIGNLSFRTTQDALREFFDGVGTITRINMPIRHGKQDNMGFAYVDFDTPDAKVIAITLSEGQLDGRNLLIKDGDKFAGRPAKAKTEPSEGAEGDNEVNGNGARTTGGKGLSKAARKILHLQKQPPAPTLFLGNLGFETTEESIRELFDAHRYWRNKGRGAEKEQSRGENEGQGGNDTTSKDVWIRKIRMGTFEDSGACKGFAFIDFTSIEHATAALVNPRNHRLNGRDLVVEYASPDAVRRGGGPRHTKGDRHRKSKLSESGKSPQKGPANVPYTKQRQSQYAEREDGTVTAEILEEDTRTPRSRGTDRAGHNRPHARRAKPGAVLADAPRQPTAIIPSQGQKIIF